ncbi:isoleucine--tRNA ligase [Methanosalsum natronophilum]|uniref:isoleucine--tRNA ligase n=1 Tax=Methanosalsum natronophilum TaxID=768733 RepID=UPI002168903A|nr:isoleucine--tRNA ligase [Methanosalsum natronophilum]MCS3924499.1 isoleucyl-tRNA synthetase [Methanosalsum natronophilum]
MIEEVNDKYDAQRIETGVQELWRTNSTYEKVRAHRKDGKKLFFVDGPPYPTGKIHLGTAWNKIIKDSLLRYYSMNNYHLQDRAGWDMHGLPIEVKVEGVLGFKSKKDIESYGVENFIDKCKEFAMKNKGDMTLQFQRLGSWLDWDEPYMTLKDEYIEAAWWTLKRAHENNLIDRGERVVNWCPRCATAIADSEVDYEDKTDPSVYIKFKVNELENTHIVIWTTTPWTIPSNMAVAVHPQIEYAKVKAINSRGGTENLIMAKDLVENVLKMGRYTDYEIIETILGVDLTGYSYEHPLSDIIPKQSEFEHNIYLAEFVTAENSGCVHIAPGHGLDDFEVGVKHNLPIFCPVDHEGLYTEDVGKYAGLNVKEANSTIIDDLEARQKLISQTSIQHRYGHCWRCKSSIIYLATVQWFIKVSEMKEDMLEEIKNVEWTPEWAGSSRFKDWIEGARDWCISRQRYWGIPIPVWKCDVCDSLDVIGTKKELMDRANIDNDIELHRPYVDQVVLDCKCGGNMNRVEDVFDVWFDSAVASWATLNFPQDSETFEQWWPADFITEGHDQTRGWFYSQLGASMIAFGKAPYKSVLMHGFTLDQHGKKMSKSLGNIVEPSEVIEKYGADTLRIYVLSTSAPWEDLKFNWEGVANIHRLLNILWNVYRFPLPYMSLDNFNPLSVQFDDIENHLRMEDKWIISRMNTVIQEVTEYMEKYMLHRAVRKINEFIVEDLSRWYIQLIRPRTWIEADDSDKLAAYRVLYDIFVTLSKLIAPFTPHLAEEMYRNLQLNVYNDALPSVHMCDWPEVNKGLQNIDLEKQMRIARSIVESCSNARQKVKRKLRWPVKRIVISAQSEDAVSAARKLETVLKDQANAKQIEVVDVGSQWEELGVVAVPETSKIGPEFKKDAGLVIQAIKTTDASLLYKTFKESDEVELYISNGEKVTINRDMVNFTETVPEEVASAEFSDGIVYVDAALTREIESEGFAREVIRRVQDMRKDMQLAVEENIFVSILIEDERVRELVFDLKDFIAKEVRAEELRISGSEVPEGDRLKDWDVESISITIGLTPSKKR